MPNQSILHGLKNVKSTNCKVPHNVVSSTLYLTKYTLSTITQDSRLLLEFIKPATGLYPYSVDAKVNETERVNTASMRLVSVPELHGWDAKQQRSNSFLVTNGNKGQVQRVGITGTTTGTGRQLPFH
jgi:hypothetical protein